jgi:hypothetical protein
VGADRALNVVGVQALLMSGVRDYRALAAVARHESQLLASAAALDYVLMLATQTAGAPVPAAQADRAIRDGLARAVDDALLLLRAIAAARDSAAHAFVRNGLATLRAAIDAEALADDNRRFALIALADEVSA